MTKDEAGKIGYAWGKLAATLLWLGGMIALTIESALYVFAGIVWMDWWRIGGCVLWTIFFGYAAKDARKHDGNC